MSELLINGLTKTQQELEFGVADAESELARTEEYCRKLEHLIAVGKATLHAAAQVNIRAAASVTPSNIPPAPPATPAKVEGLSSAVQETVQAGATDASTSAQPDATTNSDSEGGSALRKRLVAQAQKSS